MRLIVTYALLPVIVPVVFVGMVCEYTFDWYLTVVVRMIPKGSLPKKGFIYKFKSK